MKKIFAAILCLILFCSVLAVPALADVDYSVDNTYNTYIYNSSQKPVYISAAYTVDKVITGSDISDRKFANLSDIYYCDGRIYICDTENDRIIATDDNFNKLYEVSSFSYNGEETALKGPEGVWANADNLYVADTANGRIVSFKIGEDSAVINQVFEKPDIKILGKDFQYSPKKLTVDSTGKMYVISAGINQGLICLDETGKFQSFLGAPQVEPNFFETLWRRLATKEQLDRMESYVPTEYNAITMDSYGFLYVASQTSNSVPVGKLNSDGDNVLAEPKIGSYGDLVYLTDETYAPYFTDVALYDSKRIGEDFYYVVDSKQGRVYAYTEDGYLLYAFGMNGEQKGTFYNATAIEYIPSNDGSAGRLLITDGFKGTITVLKETDFAVSIRNAIRSYNLGDYDNAKILWKKVRNTCSNYRLAEIGLAKIEIHNKEYRAAMKRLMVIREHDLYSIAFEGWRDSFLRDNFGWMLVLVFVLLVGLVVVLKLSKKGNFFKKITSSETYKGYKYGNYVMLHPFDGFWDLKHEKRGNVKSATIIAVLFFLIWGLRAQLSGYVVTSTVFSEVNALFSMLTIFLPLALFIVANWCFTTLMDGKGTLKDIYIATCYALKPYTVFGIPMLILSNVLTFSEVAFYTFFNTVIVLWMIFLLLAGLMMTHDYSLSKTVLTVILILVGICLIIFIFLLVLSIFQNIYQFIYNTYQEISFRSY